MSNNPHSYMSELNGWGFNSWEIGLRLVIIVNQVTMYGNGRSTADFFNQLPAAKEISWKT